MSDMRARDLRIGDRFGTSKNGDPLHVTALHELCLARPEPHVHVVTKGGGRCLNFDAIVSRVTHR